MRRHPPQLVNPSDVVRQATERQLGIRPARNVDRRLDNAERLLAQHDREFAEAIAVTDDSLLVNVSPTGAPSIATLTAAGTTATASITGNDEDGFIQLVPGGTGITTGGIVTVTFGLPRGSVNYSVMVQPASSAARTIGQIVGPTNRTTTTWQLVTGTALTSGATYQYWYRIVQYA